MYDLALDTAFVNICIALTADTQPLILLAVGLTRCLIGWSIVVIVCYAYCYTEKVTLCEREGMILLFLLCCMNLPYGVRLQDCHTPNLLLDCTACHWSSYSHSTVQTGPVILKRSTRCDCTVGGSRFSCAMMLESAVQLHVSACATVLDIRKLVP